MFQLTLESHKVCNCQLYLAPYSRFENVRNLGAYSANLDSLVGRVGSGQLHPIESSRRLGSCALVSNPGDANDVILTIRLLTTISVDTSVALLFRCLC